VPQRHYVCEVAELPEGTGKECVVGDRVVAVFKLGEDVVALDGICPHAGGPLAQGMVRHEIVTCPWHGWQYHVRTGQHQLNPRICVATFGVVVADGKVYVELPDGN
jgi:nitrite reductase (NADH) small subunit